jgi:hypothetical protein
MLRHIVLFKWKPSFTDDIRAQWITGLNAMIDNIPGMIRLVHGPDVLANDKSWDHAIIADFESADALQIYNTHPLHEAIKPYSLPNVEDIAYVDFQLEDPAISDNQQEASR